MPYKKMNKKRNNKKCRKTLKQTKTLTQKRMATRLMTISLKADDYVYNKKPISTSDAEMYEQELTSFRNECNDIRYLQVIEKLTSYMKCIIKENLSTDASDNNFTAAPVQELDARYANIGSEYNLMVQTELEKSISNLSIDPNDNKKSSTDINITKNTQTVENKVKPSAIVKHNISKMSDISIMDNEITCSTITNNNNKADPNNKINSKTSTKLSKTLLASNKDIINNQKQLFKTHYDIVSNIKKVVQEKFVGNILQAKDNKTEKGKTKKVMKNELSNNIDDKVVVDKGEKKPEIRKSKRQKNAPKKGDVKHTDQSNGITPKKNIKSCAVKKNKRKYVSKKRNKRELIDLSWVGNLKFVRDIDSEEYTKFDDLGDSFWRDASLPPNINLNDFTDDITIWKN